MARHLLCKVSGQSQEYILAQRDQYASEEVTHAMEAGTRRLVEGEPLAYVLGEWEFYGLNLQVSPDVLIPRDDTCAVASLAIQKGLFLDQDPRIPAKISALADFISTTGYCYSGARIKRLFPFHYVVPISLITTSVG